MMKSAARSGAGNNAVVAMTRGFQRDEFGACADSTDRARAAGARSRKSRAGRWLGILCLLCCGFGLFGATAVLAENAWVRTSGPEGGSVYAIATAPGAMYMGIDGSGVYKSVDDGATWTPSNGNGALDTERVLALAVDPVSPTTLYAGAVGPNCVYKSTDGGVNWSVINNGFPYTFVQALAVDPNNSQTVYAGTYSDVYKSTNGGASWAPTGSGMGANVHVILVDRTDSQTVYAATQSGVYKSTNGGLAWSAATAGLSDLNVSTLVQHPTAANVLYAGNGSGVFKSTDAGASWTAVSGLAGGVSFVAFDPGVSTTMYVAINGVFRKSVDGGVSWTVGSSTGLVNTTLRSMAVHPSLPNTLYVGTQGAGVYKSADGGGSWSSASKGLAGAAVRALAISPLAPHLLYAGTYDGGSFRSSDGGVSWTLMTSGLTSSFVQAFAFDPVAPGIVYAGGLGRMYKSLDGGSNWTTIMSGLTYPVVTSLAVRPDAPATVYAGTAGGGVFRSVNGGAQWVSFGSGLGNMSVRGLVLVPSAPDTMYASTDGGLFKTSNGGANWSAVGGGLPSAQVPALAIDPSAPGTLYAAVYDVGIYKSIDGGGQWQSIDSGLAGRNTVTLAIDPLNTNTIYAGGASPSGGALRKSTNGGATWAAASSGMYASDTLYALAVSPVDAGVLYAGTTAHGVYKSGNGAVSSDARLSNLVLNAGGAIGLSPAFDPATLAYAATVQAASATLTPTAWVGDAVIRINGALVSSGTASAPIALHVGSNVLNAVVTAGDGSASRTYTVTVTRPKITQTIDFPAQGDQTYRADGTFAVDPAATATSGLAVAYASLSPSVCTVAGSVATMRGAGTCTLAANQTGDANYAAADQVTRDLTIGRGDNVIAFPAQAGRTYQSGGTFAIDPATASSSLAVVYGSLSPAVCTVAGSTVTMLGAGTCTLAANQAGDANYVAANQVTQDLTIGRGDNVITFPPQAGRTYQSGGTFAIDPPATATSGLAVVYSSPSPSVCTVAGSTVTILAAGTCTLAVDQAGNADYLAAVQVTRDVTIDKADQTLTFPPQMQPRRSFVADSTFAIDPLAGSAAPNSGNAIAYSSLTTAVCAVSDATVTMHAAGICTLAANQAGNADYRAAAQVTQDVVLTVAPVAAPQNVTVAFNTIRNLALGGNDSNPGGPFALVYAIATPPSHGTLGALDANAGTLTYTPQGNYVGPDSFTFTVSSTNGTSQPATVSLDVAAPQLALSIDGGHDYARYGEIADYVVTLTNHGDAANAVPVTFTPSQGFDAQGGSVTCAGDGDGASCVQDATNPLRFTVTLPPDRSLTWLASLPVRSDTTDDGVELRAEAIGATPLVATSVLVIFKNGFDVPSSEGAQSVPVVEGAAAAAILDGDALREVEVSASPSAAMKPLLIVRNGTREVRVECRVVAGAVLVRLFERDADGHERATAWSTTQPGARLDLGSVAPDVPIGAGADAPPRAIVLAGARAPLVLH